MVLICISLMISYGEYFFMYSLDIWMSTQKKCLFRSSADFLIRLSFLLSCMSSLCFRQLIFYQIDGLQVIFFPICRLPFHFVDQFLCCTEAFFSLIQPSVVYFIVNVAFLSVLLMSQLKSKSTTKEFSMFSGVFTFPGPDREMHGLIQVNYLLKKMW